MAVAVLLVACGEQTATEPAASPSVRASFTAVVFPPTTVDEAKRLANAEGDGSAVREFHSESVGLATCPQPKRSVTVAGVLSGRQVVADLLKYFYDQNLDNDCGSLVLAYMDSSQYGSVYTVGRVILNVDGKHQLEVDAVPESVTFRVDY